MQKEVGALANLNLSSGPRECLQPTWEKGASREQHILPCKGHHGLDFGGGQNGVLLVWFVPAFGHIRRKPSESVPFSLIALKSGLQQGILPPKIQVTYSPSVLPLLHDSCQLHPRMPRAADECEHICSPQQSLLELAPSRGWHAELRSSTSPKNEMLPFCVTNLVSDWRDEGKCLCQAQLSLRVSA